MHADVHVFVLCLYVSLSYEDLMWQINLLSS